MNHNRYNVTMVEVPREDVLFCYKLRIVSKRGRATTNEVWVFGLVDTSHTLALGYMEVVAQQDAATLLSIIQAHVIPGTIIHSDQWAAYNQLVHIQQ